MTINPIPSENEFYMATLTYPDGLTDVQMANAKKYFKRFEYCIVSHELGKNGSNDHLHALYHTKAHQTKLVRAIKKEVYGLKARDEVNKHMIRVEKVKSFIDCIGYISKDVDDGKYFVRCGFQPTWITEKVKEAFNKRRLYKKWKNVPVDQAPHCIIEYAKTNNLNITSKDDFIEIVKKMMKDGINTRSWVKQMEWIYSVCMLENGDDSASNALLNNSLRFV